ncbi:unnamed protein product [Symbiodinium natans]|uniref:Uncharacterized protein n=1 Tax=Symbiodinium natans TaxID=878477 RepID=A0A812IGT3_9DINO|nr:unnamed protein product [Symbiodinium natans]
MATRCRSGRFRGFRAGALLAIVALSSRTLADCFSRIASARPEGSTETDADEALAPAAAAWLRAARRTAEGRKDSAAYWEVAWETTEAWWLRPIAFTVSALVTMGAILQQQPGRLWRSLQPKPVDKSSEALEQALQQARADSTEVKVRKTLRGLQRMELPFFGTSSSWSNVMGGVVVSGNPREGAIENWPVSEAVLRQSVESELGYPVLLHLLRTEEKEGELSRPYELLVRDADETPGVLDMMMPLISFAIVWWCSTQLDSNSSLQQLGAVIQPGSSPPWVMVLVLLLVGELARTVVASQNGTSVGPRTFLPSPQFGLIGVFAQATTASPNRSAALATSLAAPVAVAVASLLLALGADLTSDMVDLKTSSLVGCGPLAFLPEETSAARFAAMQGLLMSALALLPQSPDGRTAWSVLVGRAKAKQLADTASYVYPLLGVLSMWCFGSGFLSLPFTWALLLTNISPGMSPPPFEEASEPPEPESRVALALLVLAAVAAAPLPWAQLMGA